MEKILKILNELNSEVDFTIAEGIVTNELIDSINITVLITELEDTFGIEIGMDDIIHENFDTVKALWAMIQRLQA